MSGLLILFSVFFKIGMIGFGGGYAIVSLLMNELVRLGVTMDQFSVLLALDMVIPGPVATNAATYLGYIHSGIPGSVIATIGVSLPSYLLVFSLREVLKKYRETTLLSGAMNGAKSAAVGLLASAALTIGINEIIPGGMEALFSGVVSSISWLAMMLFALSLAAAKTDKISPLLLTVLGGIFGGIFLRG